MKFKVGDILQEPHFGELFLVTSVVSFDPPVPGGFYRTVQRWTDDGYVDSCFADYFMVKIGEL